MKRIIFATRNIGKFNELKGMMGEREIELISLRDLPHLPEVEEDGGTYAENALKKAKAIFAITGEYVLADDSGIEVEVLNGAPGVHSARYAGKNATDWENMEKLLAAMKDIPWEKRKALYRCVLVFYNPAKGYDMFEGNWSGIVYDRPMGTGGFGYDPIFYLPELKMTAAQLPMDLKNRLSHRGQAFARFIAHLNKLKSGRSAAW